MNAATAQLHPLAETFREHDYAGKRAAVLAAAREGRATIVYGDIALFHHTAWVYIDGQPFAQASTVHHYVRTDPTDPRRSVARLIPGYVHDIPRALRQGAER